MVSYRLIIAKFTPGENKSDSMTTLKKFFIKLFQWIRQHASPGNKLEPNQIKNEN